MTICNRSSLGLKENLIESLLDSATLYIQVFVFVYYTSVQCPLVQFQSMSYLVMVEVTYDILQLLYIVHMNFASCLPQDILLYLIMNMRWTCAICYSLPAPLITQPLWYETWVLLTTSHKTSIDFWMVRVLSFSHIHHTIKKNESQEYWIHTWETCRHCC